MQTCIFGSYVRRKMARASNKVGERSIVRTSPRTNQALQTGVPTSTSLLSSIDHAESIHLIFLLWMHQIPSRSVVAPCMNYEMYTHHRCPSLAAQTLLMAAVLAMVAFVSAVPASAAGRTNLKHLVHATHPVQTPVGCLHPVSYCLLAGTAETCHHSWLKYVVQLHNYRRQTQLLHQ